MRPLVLVCLVGLTTALHAQEPGGNAQKDRGFALEAHLGTQLLAISGSTTLGSFAGGFLLGAKLNRVIVGIGFDVARVATSERTMNNATTGDATTALYVTPGVRVAILRSADRRVEMFGQLDLGLGGAIVEERPEPTGPQPDVLRFRLMYNVGPGVRFWAHPQFGLSAVTGVHGDFAYTRTSQTVGNTTVSSTQTSTVTSIFAQLQFTGVF